MSALPHPEQTRELVLRTFTDLCGRSVRQHTLSETVLIRQDYYYGRAYRAHGLLATLVAESAALHFYTQDGQLLRSVSLAGEGFVPTPQRQAA